MRTITVKDGDWLAEMYGWNKVKVYVGETKAEHLARRKHEYDLIIYNRENKYSGFDDEPDREWDHE
jgi:hypothetical protein